jgi:hypothetical protein
MNLTNVQGNTIQKCHNAPPHTIIKMKNIILAASTLLLLLPPKV